MTAQSNSHRAFVSRINPAWVATALLIALNLLNYIDRYILPGVQPLIQKEFHSNDTQMGALTLALIGTYMFCAPLTGWLGDRYRRKWLIIGGAVLWSICTLSTAWVHDYWTLLIRHALVGIGEASFGIYAPAVLSDFYPERDRTRILSYFYIAIPVGAALGFICGGFFGTRYGWRAPFFICAIPGLLIALFYGFFATEPVRGANDHIAHSADRSTFASLFKNKAFLTATFSLATMTFALGGISAWVPTFLQRVKGYELAQATLLLGIITVVCGVFGTLIGCWIAQRWLKRDHRALYFVSFWSLILTVPFAAMVFFGPSQFCIPSLFIAEFLLFLNTGPLNTAMVNSVGAPIRATAVSLNLFCTHFFGDVPSPIVIGAISDKTGNLSLALGVTLIALIVSALILLPGAKFAPILEDDSTALEEQPV